jgi:hypothetical protein
MRWVKHVAHMGEGRNVYRVLVGKSEGKDHLKGQGTDGRMESEWILGRLAVGVWSGFTWLRIGTGGSSRECGNERLGSSTTELIS